MSYKDLSKWANLLRVQSIPTVAVLAICLLALVGTMNMAEADSPPKNGKIVFRDYLSGGDPHFYAVDPEGSSPTRLNLPSGVEDSPNAIAWSPDGTKLAYFDGENLSIMDADGSNRRDILTDLSKTVGALTWSPDATKLAFGGYDPAEYRPELGAEPPSDIYTVRLDGSNLINLTKTPKLDETSPDFSSDGSRVCFNLFNGISGALPDDGLYVMNAVGSVPTLLVKLPDSEGVGLGGCQWSPDGTKVAFGGTFEEFDDSEVYTINADGSGGRTALTSNSAEDGSPVWSPDGTKITFARATYRSAMTMNGSDIYTMDDDGSDVAQVTKTSDVGEEPFDWQPLPIPNGANSRDVMIRPPDTGGLSLLLVASALIFSGCVMFYAGVKSRT